MRAEGQLSGVGRPRGVNTSEATRARILDAAEKLFAEDGYDGASIRDIAASSSSAVAVVTYHFGAKDQLFDAVVSRRATVMGEMRLAGLEAARLDAADGPVPVETMLRIYVRPFIDKARHGDPGWRNYAVLMGRLSDSPRGTAVIHRHYDEIAVRFLWEFKRTLPLADPAAIVAAFMVTTSAMLFTCAATGRTDALLQMLGESPGQADPVEQLIRFCAPGYASLQDVPEMQAREAR